MKSLMSLLGFDHPNAPTFWEQARQCFSSTREGYDLLAPKFEFTPYRTPDDMLEAVGEVIGRQDFETALDVCCGTGAGMKMLRPLAGNKVVGMDFSSGMLECGKEILETDSKGDAELEFVLGNVLEMDFEEQFDVATCFGALGHIVGKDTVPFIRRVHAALKPGGRFVFISSDRPSVFSLVFWLCHGFNLAMRIRNLIYRPKFIMFYLTFLLPDIRETLEENGFRVEIESPESLGRYKVVVATRKS